MIPRPTLSRGTRRGARMSAAILAASLLLAGCATGSDAVAQGGGGTFDFVSPGGKTELFFDPPSERGTIGSISGPDLMDTDRTISLDDFAGSPVVINVWGQWCAPCRAEADQLEQVYRNSKDRGVQFLGINVRDNTIDKARDFVIDRSVGYPSIWDPPMRTLAAFGSGYPTSVVPTTVVLDSEHRVAAVFLRDLLVEDLQPVVDRVADGG